MKKILFGTVLLTTLSVISYAQSDTAVVRNKKGHPILPKAGDIGLGINAAPVLSYFITGLFNPNVGDGYSTRTSNQITGKYFLDAHTAIRARLGVNTLSGSITNYVQDAIAMDNALKSGTPNDIQAASTVTVKDKFSYSKANIAVAVGYEKRRGYGRLQGFYGVELGIGCLRDNSNTTYGNAFSDQYASTYTSDWANFGTSTLNPTVPGSTATRNLDTNFSSVWRFGIRGFIGVEYFIIAKISVGAEFGWGYSVTWGQGYQVTNETYFNGQTGPADVSNTINTGRATFTRGFAVDNNSGEPQPYAISTLVGSNLLTGTSGSIVFTFYF